MEKTPISESDQKVSNVESLSNSSKEKVPDGGAQSSSTSGHVIEELQIGVRKIRIARPSGGRATSYLSARASVLQDLPVLIYLIKDIIAISPYYTLVYLLWAFWFSVSDSVEMYISNRLLQLVEQFLSTGKLQGKPIMLALIAHCCLSTLSNYIEWLGGRAKIIVESKVTRHFQILMSEADIRLDLMTSKKHRSEHEARAFKAYDALINIVQFITGIIRALTQLALVVSVSTAAGGHTFVLLCIMHPLSEHFLKTTVRNSDCLTFINNKDQHRLDALEQFANGRYRQDIISNGLGNWVLTQMKQANKLLGDIPNYPVWMLFYDSDSYEDSPLPSIAIGILGELPMAFSIFNALSNPGSFSIASLAILRSSEQKLRQATSALLDNFERFNRSIADVKGVYLAAESRQNVMDKGVVPYPPPSAEETGDKSSELGMSFELRNVSFSYPGAESGAALQDISLDIKAGSLVVLVGANGSGKSTLVRLLSRLYEPSPGSGEFLIDGMPAEDYRMDDLYKAIALLSQENLVYPFSLRENISLGSTHAVCEEEIEQAARLGGAHGFISRFEKGLDTELEVFNDVMPHNLSGKKDHPLVKEMKNLRKDIDISGGEKQRLVASRTFMRLKSGAVKFIAVDEPSSALDAEGELHLFNNLLTERKGKTMVFVTHRFGHLTSHADMIVCMKAGQIVEVGTHSELIQRENGEYANLYKIQASAYA